MSHTPGPWHVDGILTVWAGERPIVIADPCGQETLADHAENLNLIAAAPDLLRACEAFIAGIDRTDERECGAATIQMARAAIAKARGTEGA